MLNIFYYLIKIDDIPKFLKGKNKENALHISILHIENSKKKKELIELKKKILSLKKSMLYAKVIDEKLVNLEAMDTFRSGQISTFRSFTESLSDQTFRDVDDSGFNLDNSNYFNENKNSSIVESKKYMILTNRTNKSVHFDDTEPVNEIPSNEENNLDSLTNKATHERYKKLLEITRDLKKNKSSGLLTPRSLDLASMTS